MHGQHVALRQQVVHDGEDRFLDLTRVLRATDQALTRAEVEQDEGFGPCSVEFRNGPKTGCLDDGELGHFLMSRIRPRAG